MKGGMVVQIRVSPKDCLGILDCAEAAQADLQDKSFASITSMVLSSLIQLARETHIIKEEEDGFQYANRMAPFGAGKSTRVKRKFTETLLANAQMGIAPPRLSASPVIEQPPIRQEERQQMREVTIDVKGLTAELQTLMDKQDSDTPLTNEEENRYQYLNKVLFS